MNAFTGSVAPSLRQSATMDHGGNAGRTSKSFRRTPTAPAKAARQQRKLLAGRDGGDQAGGAVVLAAQARLAADGGKRFFEVLVVAGKVLAGVGRERLGRHLVQAHELRLGQRVRGGDRHTRFVARQILHGEFARESMLEHRQREVQFLLAKQGLHFLGGQIVQGNLHRGKFVP